MTVGERIAARRKELNMTQEELARKLGYKSRSSINKIELSWSKVPLSKLERVAAALDCDAQFLMGWDAPSNSHEGTILQMPTMHNVPLVGTIACGTPILAEQNIEGDVSAPDHVHADFALRCQGDSMINARIFDGDIVYIRQQETVDDGEIAAVLIDDEATLKRVHLYEDHVVLEPENPQYRPLVYWGIDMNAVRILGKAVAFTSIVR